MAVRHCDLDARLAPGGGLGFAALAPSYGLSGDRRLDSLAESGWAFARTAALMCMCWPEIRLRRWARWVKSGKLPSPPTGIPCDGNS